MWKQTGIRLRVGLMPGGFDDPFPHIVRCSPTSAIRLSVGLDHPDDLIEDLGLTFH